MNLNDLTKAAVSSSCECSSEFRNKILKVALSVNQSPNEEYVKIIEKISAEYNTPKEKVKELIGIYLAIIRFFVESNDKEFNSKLLELGFTNEFVQELPLVTKRTKVIEAILNSRAGELNKLVSLKWRIDISLTNSVLVKKIPTSVILCLQLKDGTRYTININIRTFHKLRYNVALIMKEIANVTISPQIK